MPPEQPDAADHRRVRSFVRRAGRITQSQQRALEEWWPHFGLETGTGQIDLDAAFGRTIPVVVEIGFGNGDTLAQMAEADQDTNFLGIEVHRAGIGHCLLEIKNRALENVRLLEQDAVEVLATRLAPGSVSRVNLFFSDPWPKKRHHKRRIVQPSFVSQVCRVLCPFGLFHIATDWQPYAEHIADVMSGSAGFEPCETPRDRPQSKFEARGRGLGHEIWERAWTRQPD